MICVVCVMGTNPEFVRNGNWLQWGRQRKRDTQYVLLKQAFDSTSALFFPSKWTAGSAERLHLGHEFSYTQTTKFTFSVEIFK